VKYEPYEVNKTKVSCDLESSGNFNEEKEDFKHLGDVREMKVARPTRLLTIAAKKTTQNLFEI